MKKLADKVLLACAVILCLMIIAVGVAIWFVSGVWIFKFVLSFVAYITGIAFFIMAIDLWRDE